MDAIAPLTSGSAVYAAAKDLGLAPAVVFVLCYLHFLVALRPVFVKGLAILEFLFGNAKGTDDQLAAATARADREVPTAASPIGIFEALRKIAGKTAIALLAIGLAVACAAAQPKQINMTRIHESVAKVQRGLELELRATAPISSAHETHRQELRADVAALVSATAPQ